MIGQATFPTLLLGKYDVDGRPLENKNKLEVFSHKNFENPCRESKVTK